MAGACRLYQVVRTRMYRVIPACGLSGNDAVQPHPRMFIRAMNVMRDVEGRLRSNGSGVSRLMARVWSMGIG